MQTLGDVAEYNLKRAEAKEKMRLARLAARRLHPALSVGTHVVPGEGGAFVEGAVWVSDEDIKLERVHEAVPMAMAEIEARAEASIATATRTRLEPACNCPGPCNAYHLGPLVEGKP